MPGRRLLQRRTSCPRFLTAGRIGPGEPLRVVARQSTLRNLSAKAESTTTAATANATRLPQRCVVAHRPTGTGLGREGGANGPPGRSAAPCLQPLVDLAPEPADGIRAEPPTRDELAGPLQPPDRGTREAHPPANLGRLVLTIRNAPRSERLTCGDTRRQAIGGAWAPSSSCWRRPRRPSRRRRFRPRDWQRRTAGGRRNAKGPRSGGGEKRPS